MEDGGCRHRWRKLRTRCNETATDEQEEHEHADELIHCPYLSRPSGVAVYQIRFRILSWLLGMKNGKQICARSLRCGYVLANSATTVMRARQARKPPDHARDAYEQAARSLLRAKQCLSQKPPRPTRLAACMTTRRSTPPRVEPRARRMPISCRAD